MTPPDDDVGLPRSAKVTVALHGASVIARAALKEIWAYLSATPAARRHIKAGPLHLWEGKRKFQIRFLKEVGLQPDHFLLDLGCGTLRGGIPIIEYLAPGHYYGVERRADVLAEARRELSEAGLDGKEPVLLLASELRLLDLDLAFDVIWAFSVLIHMTDVVLDECLHFANRHLKRAGALYANVNTGPRREAWLRWQGFPVVWRSRGFYEDQAARHGLAVTDLGDLRSLGDVSGIPAIDEQRMFKFHKV